MILPSLMLQKPSSKSKAKDHSNCLTRRLALWRNGEIELILRETKQIQKNFTSSKKTRSLDDVSKIFAKLVMGGKLSAAIKFLDKESSTGVITLSDSVIKELKTKHPQPAPIADSSLLYGPIDFIPKYYFESINDSRQLRWIISSCSLWETNGTVLSSLEDYPGVTHVISNGLHVISLFSCEI